jgi:hypothetical protein
VAGGMIERKQVMDHNIASFVAFKIRAVSRIGAETEGGLRPESLIQLQRNLRGARKNSRHDGEGGKPQKHA